MALPKIGAQMYTVCEFLKTPEQIASSLKRVKELGFDIVQLSGLGPIDPAELAAIVHDLALEVCITHSPIDRILNDTDALIAEHRALGCNGIGIGCMPNQYRGSLEGARALLKDTAEARKKIAAAGMTLAYHNHNFEFQKFNGTNVFDLLIEEGDDTFGFILDTFWVQAGGGDPVSYIRKVAGRMTVCHLKDMDIEDDPVRAKQVFAPVGEGNMDFVPILRALAETNVPYAVIEQDICKTDPFDCLAISKRNVENMLKTL